MYGHFNPKMAYLPTIQSVCTAYCPLNERLSDGSNKADNQTGKGLKAIHSTMDGH